MRLPNKKVTSFTIVMQSLLTQVNTGAEAFLFHAGFVMQDLRSMVAYLSGTDLAVAGHAVSMAGWHPVRMSSSHP